MMQAMPLPYYSCYVALLSYLALIAYLLVIILVFVVFILLMIWCVSLKHGFGRTFYPGGPWAEVDARHVRALLASVVVREITLKYLREVASEVGDTDLGILISVQILLLSMCVVYVCE